MASHTQHRSDGAAMRVLLCVDSLGVGGKERQAVALIKGLAGVPGLEARVVCFEGDDFYLPDLQAAGIPVEFILRKARWDPRPVRRLSQITKEFRPDVIHTNGFVSSAYGWLLATRWRVPLVNGSIRNAFADGDFRWALERFLLAVSDYRLANSSAGLRSRGFRDEDPRNVVVYNGFDFGRLNQPRDSNTADSITRHGHQWVVGMVAEFNVYKDHRTFIEAARIVSARRQDVLFVAVGSGETLSRCQAAAQGLTNVMFLGARKDVERIVRSFDIGVLCTFVEGLSNSVMEYMALGKPVIATDGGGTREIVVDGTTGLLVKPSDAAAVADAVEYLISNPDRARQMGQEGENRLKREFTLQKMIESTVAVYRTATARRIQASQRVHEFSGNR